MHTLRMQNLLLSCKVTPWAGFEDYKGSQLLFVSALLVVFVVFRTFAGELELFSTSQV